MQYGASLSQRAARRDEPDGRLHRQPGRDMFLRGVANTFDNVTRVRPVPSVGQVDYKTSGCLDGLVINGNADHRLRRGELRRAADRPEPPLPLRPHRRPALPVLAQRRARRRARTKRQPPANTFDYNTEFGPNPSDIPHTFNGSLDLHAARSRVCWAGGWRVGGIVNARSGVPINVTINRPDTVIGRRRHGDQRPRRQHAAARSAPISSPASTRT